MRLFLCQARRRTRSIVNLCEEFGYRSVVQKEIIRTIFLILTEIVKSKLYLCREFNSKEFFYYENTIYERCVS